MWSLTTGKYFTITQTIVSFYTWLCSGNGQLNVEWFCVLKDRDKLLLTRSIVFELVQALKFKVLLPDENLLLLVQVGADKS